MAALSRRRHNSVTIPISISRRDSNNERISSSLGSDTQQPLFGSEVTRPSASSCLSAARTDVRLTLNSSAREASPSFMPGRSERLLMAWYTPW
ncbi:hypothetical protein FQZ97_722160 [compost metagenome]